jgi:hypothetical protein
MAGGRGDRELIQQDKVDLVPSAGAPDTVNLSATCARRGCLSLGSASVWQAFTSTASRRPMFHGPMRRCSAWIYHRLFAEMFDQVPNNKTVGMLFANDADAAGWMRRRGGRVQGQGYHGTTVYY